LGGGGWTLETKRKRGVVAREGERRIENQKSVEKDRAGRWGSRETKRGLWQRRDGSEVWGNGGNPAGAGKNALEFWRVKYCGRKKKKKHQFWQHQNLGETTRTIRKNAGGRKIPEWKCVETNASS